MIERSWIRFLNSLSGNRKSAIQNPKWLGLLVIAFVLVTVGTAVQAQQSAKIPRIGYLTAAHLTAIPARIEALRQGLRELGYIEGKTILIEWRSSEERADRLPVLAAELVRLKVDVIVTGAGRPTRAAKEATRTIPIVMAQDSDPVGNGFIASLAHPGGNITGLATLHPEVSGKRLEILREVVPNLSRVALVGTSTSPGYAQVEKDIEFAAKAFRVKIENHDILNSKDIETAFRAATKDRADSFLTLPSGVLFSYRSKLIALATRNRLPGIYHDSQYVDDGGLMNYSESFTDLHHRAAMYVDKILKGAKPADLPVEQPTKFEFIINLKAAKQIDLTIPPNVLARADRVIR